VDFDEALRAAREINVAVGIVMTLENVDSEQARALLERTSRTAGTTVAEMASRLVEGCRGLWVMDIAVTLLPSLEAELRGD
jgi:AmiR/NasT family two-component response regulator